MDSDSITLTVYTPNKRADMPKPRNALGISPKLGKLGRLPKAGDDAADESTNTSLQIASVLLRANCSQVTAGQIHRGRRRYVVSARYVSRRLDLGGEP